MQAPITMQSRNQFFLDLALSLSAGLLAGFFNLIAFAFPLVSAIKLIFGMALTGFFLSLDMALARERYNLRSPAPPDQTSAIPRFFPLSRTFALISASTAVFVMVVLVFVLAKNADYMIKVGSQPDMLAAAVRSVTIEIVFIILILTLFGINVIISYSLNLRLAFENQIGVLERIAGGDFTRQVVVASADEFGRIAAYTNEMMTSLKHRITLLGALKVAEEVQRNLLPERPPEVSGLEIAALSKYSEETGGDYFDFLVLPGEKLATIVGDVSGHGVASALLMASARAFFRMASDQPGDLAEIVGRVNQSLSKDIRNTGNFLTLFLLEIDTSDRRLTWVRAGHDPGLLFDPVEDNFHELDGKGIALGLSESAGFEIQERKGWNVDSILVLGTDGVWETRNEQRQMFGKERLKQLVRTHARLHPQVILDRIMEALSEFRGPADQEDDVTLVLIKMH